MIKRRLILIILTIIGSLGLASFISLLVYFDPYIHVALSVTMLAISFMLFMTSFISLLIYFFKKIYYRGEVGVYHVFSSLRQSYLFATFWLGVCAILSMQVPILIPVILLASILVFLELFIQSF